MTVRRVARSLSHMSRLSTLDASFLRVETPTAHMHVGWVAPIELPAGEERLDADALTERIRARLHLVPRFRQRLAGAPLGLAEAAWVDDDRFDLRKHVRIAERPRSLSRADLRHLTDRFFSRQLRRDRPLWELLIVPRVNGRRAAVLGKVHHAMVDGIAAVELGMVLFDLAPESALLEPVDWEPQPAAGPVRAALDAVTDTALEQFRTARRSAASGLSPGRTLRVADTMRRAAFSLAEDAVRAAPPSYLNVPIGSQRTLSSHSFRLADFSRLKEAGGVKLNDVVLAVAAGALRRLALERRGQPCDLRVMVPISVRGDSESGAEGNRITFGFIDLPVAERHASARLATIHERMKELKDSGRIGGSDLILRSVSLLPAALKDRAAHFAASPRLYNLTVSNVPGPRVPLYAAGARVTAIYPVIPIPDQHALAIGVLTYNGGVHFSGYAAADVLPRLRLSHVLKEALTELEVTVAARPRVQLPRRSPGHAANVDRTGGRKAGA
jgi:diacylglycerol O-acyltransferase / wax synthase